MPQDFSLWLRKGLSSEIKIKIKGVDYLIDNARDSTYRMAKNGPKCSGKWLIIFGANLAISCQWLGERRTTRITYDHRCDSEKHPCSGLWLKLPDALAVIDLDSCGSGTFSLERAGIATEAEKMMNDTGTTSPGHRGFEFPEDLYVEQSMAYSIG